MGYGVPAGIAANILTGRTVFTIAGDGDFLMNGQELATAVQFGAKTIIVHIVTAFVAHLINHFMTSALADTMFGLLRETQSFFIDKCFATFWKPKTCARSG
jgi:thiamine pyrophosphate-dependent acetolactate synthase large subunit-like protein